MFTGGSQASGKRILAVRLGAMGDIIHALPAVASLKHSYPGSRLTWVVEPQWAPLLAQNPFIDRVVLLLRNTPGGLWRSGRELWEEGFDFAVDFQGLIKSALVASFARPERIFGFDAAGARERAATLFYSNKVSSGARHVVEKNLDLAAAAGAASLLRTFPIPPGMPEGELPDGPFVLACPLAGWRSKQWPVECYAELARLLAAAGFTLVVNGPRSAASFLEAAAPAWRHISGLSGLIHAMRRAAAYVGVDSGPLHLAAALARPGVAIFGPTDPERNGPYGGTFTVLRGPGAATTYKRRPVIDASMLAISPVRVWQALRPVLDGHARPAESFS